MLPEFIAHLSQGSAIRTPPDTGSNFPPLSGVPKLLELNACFTTVVCTLTSLMAFYSMGIHSDAPHKQSVNCNLFQEEMVFIVEVNEVEIIMVAVGIEMVEMTESQ